MDHDEIFLHEELVGVSVHDVDYWSGGGNVEIDRREDSRRTQDKDIEKRVEEAARAAARATAIKATTGYFILLFFLFIGAFFYQRSVDSKINAAIAGSCQRVDLLRTAETNPGFQVLWKAFYLSQQREGQLAKDSNNKEAATHRMAVKQLEEFIKVLKWTPSTDCEAVQKDPRNYVPPEPRPFDESYLDLKKVPK